MFCAELLVFNFQYCDISCLDSRNLSVWNDQMGSVLGRTTVTSWISIRPKIKDLLPRRLRGKLVSSYGLPQKNQVFLCYKIHTQGKLESSWQLLVNVFPRKHSPIQYLWHLYAPELSRIGKYLNEAQLTVAVCLWPMLFIGPPGPGRECVR